MNTNLKDVLPLFNSYCFFNSVKTRTRLTEETIPRIIKKELAKELKGRMITGIKLKEMIKINIVEKSSF